MLQRDRAENPAVGLPLEAFLRFERRLQAIGPVTIGDDPAGELVDDPDAAVAHDVVDVAPQEHVRMERAIELGQQAVVLRVVKAGRTPSARSTCSTPASVSSTSRPYSSVSKWTPGVSDATSAASRGADEISRPTLPAITSGHARLVDQERVGFVDEREMERPVHESLTDPSPADRAGDRIPPLWRSRR